MSEKRFNFNVNKYQFEKEGKYFAHLDVVDAQKIVDKLNDLSEENRQLRKKIFDGLFYNCTLENENDISHLQYVFTLCKLLIDDAMEEVENEDMEFALELAEESIYQFKSRMQHFNQDKNGEKRVF